MKKVLFICLALIIPGYLYAATHEAKAERLHQQHKVHHKINHNKNKLKNVKHHPVRHKSVKHKPVKHKPVHYKPVRKKVIVPVAPAKSNRELLSENSQLFQMWALSRNYQFGTTVDKDPVKAYVWRAIYVDSLPKTYPKMAEYLNSLKANLTDAQLAESLQMIKNYQAKYDLGFRMSETDMLSAFALLEQKYQILPKPDIQNFAQLNFDQLLEQLNNEKKSLLAQQLQAHMAAAQRMTAADADSRVVFGQVLVAGPDLPSGVTAQMPISKEGYFVTVIKDKNTDMGFRLSGYQPVNVNVASDRGRVINVGEIVMKPVAQSQLAKVVGRLPLRREQLKDVNIVLQVTPGSVNSMTGQVNHRASWFWPAAHVVVLPNGQFYAKQLTPEQYILSINVPGYELIRTQILLTPGGIKELGNINLEVTARR